MKKCRSGGHGTRVEQHSNARIIPFRPSPDQLAQIAKGLAWRRLVAATTTPETRQLKQVQLQRLAALAKSGGHEVDGEVVDNPARCRRSATAAADGKVVQL